jgi:hypothetical protein
MRRAFRWTLYGAVAAALGYASWIGVAWSRYGRTARSGVAGDADPVLDRFMPVYEVSERHQIRVRAPVDVTFAAECGLDLNESAIVRSIFRTRELVLGSHPDDRARPPGLLAFTKSIGWGVLAEVPGREVVMGAVTQPWEANVTFRALPPEAFAAFRDPGYVKIVWTLRADAAGAETIARTETRVMTTDAAARAKFRRYWAAASPGILLIRRILLRLVKDSAERRS